MKKTIITTFALCFCFFNAIQAQLKTPAASTSATISQTVGITDIEIKYSRPSAKDRKVFGPDGIVLYNKLWRTGANAVTKMTFSDPISIGGINLEAGTYAVLTLPSMDKWKMHFYQYESSSWSSYEEKAPVATAMANRNSIHDAVETFTISVDNISTTTAELNLSWANAKITFPIKVSYHDEVMKNIERVMSGPSAFDYFRAGTYLHESGVELEKALSYLEKATEKNPRFFMVYREALILADLNRKPEAITKAKISRELAEKAGNDDFVRLSNTSIEKWME